MSQASPSIYDLPSPDVAAIVARSGRAVGSVEQYDPHLPILTMRRNAR